MNKLKSEIISQKCLELNDFFTGEKIEDFYPNGKFDIEFFDKFYVIFKRNLDLNLISEDEFDLIRELLTIDYSKMLDIDDYLTNVSKFQSRLNNEYLNYVFKLNLMITLKYVLIPSILIFIITYLVSR